MSDFGDGGSFRFEAEPTYSVDRADSPSVYLGDGRHFENLGPYEMVRRHCRLLVLVDVTQGPGYRYADLEARLRRIRIDLGIGISFPRGLPSPDSARTTGQKHVAAGLVHYSNADTVVPMAPVAANTLVLVKPVLSGDEPLDLRKLRRALARPARHRAGAVPAPVHRRPVLRRSPVRGLPCAGRAQPRACAELAQRLGRAGGARPPRTAFGRRTGTSRGTGSDRAEQAEALSRSPGKAILRWRPGGQGRRGSIAAP